MLSAPCFDTVRGSSLTKCVIMSREFFPWSMGTCKTDKALKIQRKLGGTSPWDYSNILWGCSLFTLYTLGPGDWHSSCISSWHTKTYNAICIRLDQDCPSRLLTHHLSCLLTWADLGLIEQILGGGQITHGRVSSGVRREASLGRGRGRGKA